ncbi:phosphotransferase, partial [Candidatus Micrarchaeota archaeon]|nr:phosphotransferase [Candidatus Micrarchaeota archaeon]
MHEYNCDLHFHGPYSGGVSKNMQIPVIAEQARLKGLDVVCTSDILHAKWLEHVKESITERGNG